jgi:hypothetical protein
MLVYLFRDKSSTDAFAISTDVTGRNIPPLSPLTEWIFVTAIDTLKLVEQWDVGNFQDLLDRLEVDSYYLFEGELKRRRPSQEC